MIAAQFHDLRYDALWMSWLRPAMKRDVTIDLFQVNYDLDAHNALLNGFACEVP